MEWGFLDRLEIQTYKIDISLFLVLPIALVGFFTSLFNCLFYLVGFNEYITTRYPTYLK